jgi:hypothetical protein
MEERVKGALSSLKNKILEGHANEIPGKQEILKEIHETTETKISKFQFFLIFLTNISYSVRLFNIWNIPIISDLIVMII